MGCIQEIGTYLNYSIRVIKGKIYFNETHRTLKVKASKGEK